MILTFTLAYLVFEVAGLGHVEVNPHHAVIRQGREGILLIDQATRLLFQAAEEPVERRSDCRKVQFDLRELRLGLGPHQFGLVHFHLILGDRLLVEQLLGVVQLYLSELNLGQLGVQPGLVKDWCNLEQHVTLFHRLALPDRDGLERPADRARTTM